MKKIVLFFCCTLVVFPLLSQEQESETPSYGMSFSASLIFSYNNAKVRSNDGLFTNTLNYSHLALQVDVDVVELLTLGVFAGYNINNFKDPVSLTTLPLSLRFSNEAFHSFIFGLNLKSEPLSSGYFSLKLNGRLTSFSAFEHDWPIELPIVSGSAAAKNSFLEVCIDVLGYYSGITGASLFLGPQFNLIKGKLSVSETIEALTGQTNIDYRQKNPFGLLAGFMFEVGDNWEIECKASLFSKLSLTLSFFYII